MEQAPGPVLVVWPQQLVLDNLVNNTEEVVTKNYFEKNNF